MGLDPSGAGAQRSPQLLRRERVVERLGTLCGERGQRRVRPAGNHRDAAESTYVAVLENRAVVEVPRGPHVLVGDPGLGDAQHAGHAEVHDQLVIVVEREQQVFAATLDLADARAARGNCGGELGRLVGAGVEDETAGQSRGELAPNGLDLGQLGHLVTVASALVSERFNEILDEATMLLDLDAARAEVWVSGLVAEWVDTDDLLAQLGASDRPEALAIARALQAFVPDAADAAAALSSAGVAEPEWGAMVGSAVALLAWEIVDPFSGNSSLVVEFEHGDAIRHSMLVELEDDCAVDINFGPPGLVEDAFAESDTRSLSVHEWPADRALSAIGAAMARTAADPEVPVTDDYVMNAAIAMARVGLHGFADAEVLARAIPVTEARSPVSGRPARDPLDAEADAAACSTLRSALARELARPVPEAAIAEAAARVRKSLEAATDPDLFALADDIALGDTSRVGDHELLAGLAGAFVVPGELMAFAAAERDALRGLEWADWLGAVIPLVRAGAGADASPMQLVQNINRCPEVTTTVPKRDAPVVADVFSRMLHAWELTGAIDDDGRLTPLGAWLVPRSLLCAWGGGGSG